jgi:hypothetical protein
MFIWCQKSFDGFPTAPVWGRFMASTAKGDKVLTTMGDVVVLPLGAAADLERDHAAERTSAL